MLNSSAWLHEASMDNGGAHHAGIKRNMDVIQVTALLE